MTTLSILMPHYNSPAGVALSLRSIEAQTWKGDREVVVCDDGSSPEHLGELEAALATTSERIKLIRNPVNRGRPYARNLLLDAADGKYTTWLDAGDELYPTKIAVQLEGLYRARFERVNRAVWCTSNVDWKWQGARKKVVVKQNVDGDQASNVLLGSLRAYLFSVIGTTRSFKDVGYFDLNLPRLQDVDFFLRFMSKGGLIVLPPTQDALCIYHKSDLGRSGTQVLHCNQYLLRKHVGLLMTHSRRFRRNRRLQQYLLAARFTSNNDDRLRTALYIAASAIEHPFGYLRWLVKSKGQL